MQQQQHKTIVFSSSYFRLYELYRDCNAVLLKLDVSISKISLLQYVF